MADRTVMPMEWLRYLKQRAEEREWEIVTLMLQMPDYPPLPECPTCEAAPEEIRSRTSDPGESALLVDFKPCGHRFKVPESELLSG
ncbi:hypothetical protein ABT119_05745 [Streptomyces sp. NPDC001910]|uniref:hypothetical protein n=1 Tax=Streptomyces sp. NPDC001910 TaxID=3154403 RepID=UPI00332A7772